MVSNWTRASLTRHQRSVPGHPVSSSVTAGHGAFMPADGFLQRLYDALTTFANAEEDMNMVGDALYLGLSVLFFGITWAFVKLCERV